MIDHRSEGKLKIDHLQIFYNCKINWIIVMKTIHLSLLLGYEYGITLIYYSKNDISRIIVNSRHNDGCFMVVFICLYHK